ncbi:hypothetical protein ACVWWP_007281 [Bradyrhizobium sp. LM3.6]
MPRSLLSLARKCHGSGLSARPPYEKKHSPKTCATVPDRSGTLFAGGKTRRSRPNHAVGRDDRCGIHKSHKGRIMAMLGFRRIEWCTPNSPTCVRSQQPFGGPRHPKPTHPLQGNHKCHWSKRSQATPTTLPRRPGQTQGPKRWLWTRDKSAHRARSAAAVSLLLAVSVSIQVRLAGSAVGGSASAPLVAMHFRPTYFPVSKLTAQYAQILRSRAAKQTCPRKTT